MLKTHPSIEQVLELATSVKKNPSKKKNLPKKMKCDALFISDLHLGSESSQAGHLCEFLQRIKTKQLYLVGDIIDLWALNHNGSLKNSHLKVLGEILDMSRKGTEVIYIPGNHDIPFRQYNGLTLGNIRLQNAADYISPRGEKFLVRHGDEFDTVLHAYHNLALFFAHLEEGYARADNFFQLISESICKNRHKDNTLWIPQKTVEAAVENLLKHFDSNIPAIKPNNDKWSLSFAIEQTFKKNTGHDFHHKTLMLKHLFKENERIFNRNARKDQKETYYNGIICGHTHIPEASAFQSPVTKDGEPIGPCHVSYYNDGSWARGLPQIGRTALAVDKDGRIFMLKWDKDSKAIAPYQPPLFTFNDYPVRPCGDKCETETRILKVA